MRKHLPPEGRASASKCGDYMKDKIDDQGKRPGVPLFGSWQNAYLAVVLLFVSEVGFFYLLSRWFL